MSPARSITLALAVLVCAWFAVGIRQAHDVARASASLSGATRLSAPAASHTHSLLRAAGFLNPDSQVDVLSARLALLRHDAPRARQILEGVVRREPKNLVAWAWLAQASLHDNPTELLTAVRKIALLNPKG